MTREEVVNYLKSSGMSDEQIKTIMDAFTCEDCISRQAVLDIVRFENKWLFDARSTNVDTDIAFNGIISKVSNLSSVQPKIKTGHWISDVDRWGDIVTTVNGYRCDKCNTFNSDKDNYCPHCGAKMEESEE